MQKPKSIWLSVLVLVSGFISLGEALSQQSLDEVKKLAYGNPFTDANESFINTVNEMASGDLFSLMLFSGWEEMEVFGKDASHIVVDSANYHIRDDRILFIEEDVYYELYPERITHVRIGDRHFIYDQYKANKRSLVASYFELLEDGDYRLLRKHVIEREVKNNHPMGLPAAREVRFRHTADLYYQTGPKARPEPLPTRKRDLIRIFRRDRDEMVIFAAENKISLRDDEEMRAFFAYYNSLAEGL
jgi:hypothetical protein